MREYIIRRVLYSIPSIIIVATVVFMVLRLLPGDAALLMVLGGEDAQSDPELYESLRHQMGLDKPIVLQYAEWMWNAAHGDFGTSYWTHEPVFQKILDRLPVTMEIGIGAVFIGVVIAIPWGVIAAVRQDHLADYLPRFASVFLISIPNFWIATMLILLPALWFHYMPPLRYVSFFDNPGANLQMHIFPWVATGTRLIGTTLRMTRSSMLEVLTQDYIRTARAKGLREFAVLARHALKNAMIPVITIIGAQFTFIFGGSVIIETVFGLPGIGNLTIQAINQRDYPQIQGNVLFFSIIIIVLNLLTDLSYAIFDPRIRYE